MRGLKPLADAFKKQVGRGGGALAVSFEGKVYLVIGVTPDLTNRFDAVSLVRDVTPLIGGQGGGGRADMAQGGGSDMEGLNAALDAVRRRLSA